MNRITILFTALVLLLLSCGDKSVPKGTEPPPEQGNETPALAKGFMTARVEELDQSGINTMKSWGAKLIRVQVLPTRYAINNGKDIWAALPDYLNILKQKVDMAKNSGFKVVIDLHEPLILKDGQLSNSSYWNTKEFWDRADVKTSFIDFWKKVAELFKSSEYDDAIWGYDIYNEPVELNTIPQRWRAMAPDIIAEIRKIDQDVWIVYEPGPWGNTGGFINLQPLTDKKVIYSVHFYTPQSSLTHVGLDFYSSATATRAEALDAINKIYPGTLNGKYWDKAALVAELKPVDDFQKQYNVPIYVGEFSVITWVPVASSTQWLKDITDLFEERKWPWTYHAFREWQGWSLEQPEGIDAFWFSRDATPAPSATETERAKVIKAALNK
ncbi:MAG: glycoside hydrolase family 5 protein [Niabella sp.]